MLTSGLLTILEKGNVTEEYALVFQALCFWLFLSAWRRDFPLRSSFWIGVLGGLAFNFKQTTIGHLAHVRAFFTGDPALPTKASSQRFSRHCWQDGLFHRLVLILYLASQGAFIDYWEQAFLYNFVYIGKHEGIRRLIPVFIKGFAYLQNGWVLYLAIVGWLAGLAYAWLKRRIY